MPDQRMIKKRIREQRERDDIANPERIIQRAVKHKQKEISQKTKFVSFKFVMVLECCGKRHTIKKKLDQQKEIFSCDKCGALIAISFWRTKVPKVIHDANANRRDAETGSPEEEGDSRKESTPIKGGEIGGPGPEVEIEKSS